jgi:hypothetical protein
MRKILPGGKMHFEKSCPGAGFFLLQYKTTRYTWCASSFISSCPALSNAIKPLPMMPSMMQEIERKIG